MFPGALKIIGQQSLRACDDWWYDTSQLTSKWCFGLWRPKFKSFVCGVDEEAAVLSTSRPVPSVCGVVKFAGGWTGGGVVVSVFSVRL